MRMCGLQLRKDGLNLKLIFHNGLLKNEEKTAASYNRKAMNAIFNGVFR
jgi:hypothetical protein